MDAVARAHIKMGDSQRWARHWPGTAKLQLRLYKALQASSAAGSDGAQWAAAGSQHGTRVRMDGLRDGDAEAAHERHEAKNLAGALGEGVLASTTSS